MCFLNTVNWVTLVNYYEAKDIEIQVAAQTFLRMEYSRWGYTPYYWVIFYWIVCLTKVIELLVVNIVNVSLCVF